MIHNLGQKLTSAGPQRACNTLKTSPARKLPVILNLIYKEEKENIIEMLCEKEKRMLLAASEKGASSWLSALPLKKLGYIINKQEFRDSICLWYGWKIPNTPIYCGCGQKN